MTTHASKETVAARLAQLPYLPMENLWALWINISIAALAIITAPGWKAGWHTRSRKRPSARCRNR